LYVLTERSAVQVALSIINREQSSDSDVAPPGVLVVGTLDTKANEVAYLAARLAAFGCRAVVVDSGVLGEPSSDGVAFARDVVAARSGTSLDELRRLERGEALARMAVGVKAIALELAADGAIEGAVCMGGAGVSLAVPAFEALGHGFPKLLVSPLASGSRTFRDFVGTGDVAVMHSVADIMGINAVTEPVYAQAAGYIAGAVQARRGLRFEPLSAANHILVAASMNGNTTRALMHAKERLAVAGVELVTFHANGVGGRAMEQLADQGLFRGIIDYTTTELGGHAVGGLMDAGAARMDVAGRLGLPQVLVPGCLDLITTGGYDETVLRWPGRRLYRHNSAFTLVRLSADEMAALGRTFAAKANAATGPTSICVPMRGYSIPNHPDGPFWDPEADAAFVTALREDLLPTIPLDCVDAHINDVGFVDHVVDVFLSHLGEHPLALQSDLEVAP
jgi:uncharacterized protein (UPF0261 family)